MIDGAPVAECPRAARVVADHATHRATVVGRGVGTEAQPVGGREALQIVEHDPGIDGRRPRIRVDLVDRREVPANVHDDTGADRVAGDGRPAPS